MICSARPLTETQSCLLAASLAALSFCFANGVLMASAGPIDRKRGGWGARAGRWRGDDGQEELGLRGASSTRRRRPPRRRRPARRPSSRRPARVLQSALPPSCCTDSRAIPEPASRPAATTSTHRHHPSPSAPASPSPGCPSTARPRLRRPPRSCTRSCRFASAHAGSSSRCRCPRPTRRWSRASLPTAARTATQTSCRTTGRGSGSAATTARTAT